LASKGVDAVVNFAAESHVDRSIEDPRVFIETNVLGTQVLLEAARKYKISRFIQISTDEVYGSLGPTGAFSEITPLAPNSPYSASKTAADLLVRAYYKTYGLATIITRCSNNYGPYQFPEKLIPLMISNALEDKPLPVYGDGMNVRDWIFVEDHCRAIDLIVHKGREGEVYNIGASNEVPNIEIVKTILNQLKKPESLIKFVEDRPGHDRRYAIDSTKLRNELGWDLTYSFEDAMDLTIRWYVQHQDWWKKIKSGEYLSYYERMYGHRL
jgi:dTDP-glucose 4,6-dehydratase